MDLSSPLPPPHQGSAPWKSALIGNLLCQEAPARLQACDGETHPLVARAHLCLPGAMGEHPLSSVPLLSGKRPFQQGQPVQETSLLLIQASPVHPGQVLQMILDVCQREAPGDIPQEPNMGTQHLI